MVQEVKYEIAKLLKEKGFDLPTKGFYYSEEFKTEDIRITDSMNHNSHVSKFSAPTIAQVIMWLCEKQIDLCHIVNYKNNVRKYRMGIVYIKNNVIESTFIKDENTLDFLEFDSLTEAYSSAITHVLTNLI